MGNEYMQRAAILILKSEIKFHPLLKKHTNGITSNVFHILAISFHYHFDPIAATAALEHENKYK